MRVCSGGPAGSGGDRTGNDVRHARLEALHHRRNEGVVRTQGEEVDPRTATVAAHLQAEGRARQGQSGCGQGRPARPRPGSSRSVGVRPRSACSATVGLVKVSRGAAKVGLLGHGRARQGQSGCGQGRPARPRSGSSRSVGVRPRSACSATAGLVKVSRGAAKVGLLGHGRARRSRSGSMVTVRLIGQNNRSVCSVKVRCLCEGQAPRSRLGSSVEVSRIGHGQAQSLNPNSSNNYFTFKTFSTAAIYTPLLRVAIITSCKICTLPALTKSCSASRQF